MAVIRIEIRVNELRPDDIAMVKVVNELKAIRALSQVIRDGIWLITDLRAGRTDVLFNLFPHLRAALVQDTVQYKMPHEPFPNHDLAKQLAEIAFKKLRPDLARYVQF